MNNNNNNPSYRILLTAPSYEVNIADQFDERKIINDDLNMNHFFITSRIPKMIKMLGIKSMWILKFIILIQEISQVIFHGKKL